MWELPCNILTISATPTLFHPLPRKAGISTVLDRPNYLDFLYMEGCDILEAPSHAYSCLLYPKLGRLRSGRACLGFLPSGQE
jgi:hypothetical protein